MTDDPDFLNPYASSGSNTATQATVKQSYIKFLVRSAIVLVLPPIPLYLWSAENEPFLGPPRNLHLVLIGIAGLVSALCLIWAVALITGLARRWLPRSAMLYLLVPCIAGWISACVVYDFGCDQRWFS